MKTADRAVREVVEALDSDLFRALAEPARVEIVKQLLLNGRSDISSIAQHLSQDRSVVSRHLKVMHEAGLVLVEREGRHRHYALAGASLIGKLRAMLRTIEIAVSCCCPPPR